MAKCKPFPQANRVLGKPKDFVPTEQVGSIEGLPVFSNDYQCISMWKLSFRERLSALFFGKVWLAVLSGKTQPPVYVEASKNYFTA